MADERITETNQPHTTTTIIERRSGGSILIGLAVLALVVVLALFLFSQNRNDAARTDAISGAAKSVDDGAEKIGAAAEKAVE